MIDLEFSFRVAKPAEVVFDLISDISRYRKWVPEGSSFFIENKLTSDGPIGLGTTYIDLLKYGGKSIGEIVEFERPSKVAFQQRTFFGLPVFSARVEYFFETQNDFTEITHHLTAKGHGLFRMLEPVLSMVVSRERKKTCEAIKQAFEKR
jgi:ribosome-associated toxin RatA of RatAB toxin-antitoxin module